MVEQLTLHEAARFLNHLEASQYWESTIPSEEDNIIGEICRRYQHSVLWECEEFRRQLENNGWKVLWAFLRRAAMLGARERSDRWVTCGLVALTICAEEPETEYYDVLIDVSILYHSARLVGDPRRIFEAGVEHVSDERVRRLILGFLDRGPRDQRLEAMGWEAIEGPSGLIYRFGNRPIPEGHL